MDLSNETSLHGIRSVWVQSVSVPNVFYNIDTHNNEFRFNYGVSAHQITVPPGFYTIADLIANLETQIDLSIAPDTVTIVLDNITKKLTLTFTNPTAQIFSTDTQPIASTLAPFLGFTVTTAAALSVATADEMPNLSGEEMIFLHSKDINGGNTTISTAGKNGSASTNRNISTFCSIPVKVPFLNVISYESVGSDIDHINLEGARDMANISIKLRSSDGRLLHLGDNHELIIVLKVFY